MQTRSRTRAKAEMIDQPTTTTSIKDEYIQDDVDDADDDNDYDQMMYININDNKNEKQKKNLNRHVVVQEKNEMNKLFKCIFLFSL